MEFLGFTLLKENSKTAFGQRSLLYCITGLFDLLWDGTKVGAARSPESILQDDAAEITEKEHGNFYFKHYE